MLRWSNEVNKLVMKCYIQSDPSKKEEKKKKKKKKRKRMVTIWAEKGVFETNYGVG